MNRHGFRPLAVVQARKLDIPDALGASVAKRDDRAVRRDHGSRGAAFADAWIDHRFIGRSAETVVGGEPQRHIAAAGINLGELLRQLHRYQEALQCLEEALQLLTAIGNLIGLASCHFNLGNVYRDLEAYETALQHYLKGEDIAVQIGKAPHHHAHGALLMAIATTYSKLGNHREALHYYRQVLEVSRKIGDWPDVVATLRRLAVTHEILREFPEALVCYQEALQLSRDLRDRQEERTILATMAHLYRQQLRDFHAALPCYHQSLALWEETGEDAGRLALLKGLGATCWNLGRYEEAAAAFEQALQIVEAAGDQAEQAAVRSSLGVVSGNLRRYATALAHLREGLAIAKAMADLRAQGYILNALGNVYYEVGDQRMAKDCYQQAVQLRRLMRDRPGEGWSCYYLGRAHGEAEELDFLPFVNPDMEIFYLSVSTFCPLCIRHGS